MSGNAWSRGDGHSELDLTDSMTLDFEKKLGAGTFSQVYRSVHQGALCAIKIIDKTKFFRFQAWTGTRLTLDSEVDILSELNHVGILRLLGSHATDKSLFLITELCLGGDLLMALVEDGFMQEFHCRRLFKGICEAVKYIHVKSIVHRDLKPDNILLTSRSRSDMHPKLADFGLATKILPTGTCRTFCGTPCYMAPELISLRKKKGTSGNDLGYGSEVDMWSLGVILYVSLSSEQPFENNASLDDQILTGRYEFDGPEWKTVSLVAKDLVNELLRRHTQLRFTAHQACEHQWLHDLV
jgi:serine/threonine protein kinase